MQTAGRTARNAEGLVMFYADKITESMRLVIEETERRRAIQHAYNEEHGIVPQTIKKSLEEIIQSTSIADVSKKQEARKHAAEEKQRERRELTPKAVLKHLSPPQLHELIEQMKLEMKVAAKEMEFERAADIRDEIVALEKVLATTTQNA